LGTGTKKKKTLILNYLDLKFRTGCNICRNLKFSQRYS